MSKMGVGMEEDGGSGGISLFVTVMMISTAAALGYVGWKMILKRLQAQERGGPAPGQIVNPTNWPVVGMLPGLLQNASRIHDYATEILQLNGGTFELKGPWGFANLNMLLTCDPANINHILCKNFRNYPKGPHFQKIFEILGDGMVNTDHHLWELHRKTTMPLMNHPDHRARLEKTVSDKIRHELFPLLEHHAQKRDAFGLKQVFRRMAFDIACAQFLDKDPCSLGVVGGDDHPFLAALRDAVNAVLYRHFLPEWCWKLQKWVVGVDREEKLGQAWRTFDDYINPIISDTMQQNEDGGSINEFSMLRSHMNAFQGMGSKFLRDNALTLIIAGSDTTGSTLTWLFWLLAKNPSVEAKILDEIRRHRNTNKQEREEEEDINMIIFNVEECQKLTYLHAAVCESLRLFPSVPLNHKMPTERDVLPSGHTVKPHTKIIMPFYSTGRMAYVWGEDCMEFKPERWISPATGGIQHQPSYKFPAFNAGPRSCIGRDMAFTVVKMVAAAILYRYRYELLAHDCPIEISESVLLEMKDDLKVVFTHR
ncbi:unnamed protein product [Cuscuta epithymum]|uniref:Cytochrome P450 n=1 Tax=Cuscuta epithymum TaxID=186058 RepID=A0AAV0FTZ5_9ASTE|nr:unnamed protein product [Cuscuta epithymum]